MMTKDKVRKTATRLFILMLLLLVACGRDLEQAKKYSDIKSETDSLIFLANSIKNEQMAKADSLRKIREAFLAAKTQNNKLPEIDRRITEAVEIEFKFDDLINHLKAIKKFAENGQEANEKIIYFKRKYMTYATVIQVHDENILIQEITDGLTAKQYISKYLRKDSKQN